MDEHAEFIIFAELMKAKPSEDILLSLVRSVNPLHKTMMRYANYPGASQLLDKIKNEASSEKKKYHMYYVSQPFIQLFLEFGLFETYDYAIENWRDIKDSDVFVAFNSIFNLKEKKNEPDISIKTIKNVMKHVMKPSMPRLTAHFMYSSGNGLSGLDGVNDSAIIVHILEFSGFNNCMNCPPELFFKMVKFVKKHNLIPINTLEESMSKSTFNTHYFEHVHYIIILMCYGDLLRNKAISQNAITTMKKQRRIQYDKYNLMEKYLLNEIHAMNKTDVNNLRESMPKSVLESLIGNADTYTEIESFLHDNSKKHNPPIALSEDELDIIRSKAYPKSQKKTMKSFVYKAGRKTRNHML